jgi:hypothetical protein
LTTQSLLQRGLCTTSPFPWKNDARYGTLLRVTETFATAAGWH